MSTVRGKVTYGKEQISFGIVHVNRKTMEIAVHPDGSVVVKVPEGTDPNEVRRRVLKRAGWITKQKTYFRQFEPRTPARRYVGGETHLYLGKHYRLMIERGELSEVKLVRGYFRLTIVGGFSRDKVKNLLDGWYAEKAASRFRESFTRCWPQFEKRRLSAPRLRIRRMKKRWGGMSSNGLLTLNIDLVRAPKACIDYVITHELCHLKWNDHGPGFYRLLGKLMPDWEKRKQALEMITT